VIGVWECRGIYMSSTTASFRVRRVHGREDMRVLTRTDGEMRYKYPPFPSLSRLLHHPHPHFQITKNRRGLGPCLFLPSLPLKVYERASHVVLLSVFQKLKSKMSLRQSMCASHPVLHDQIYLRQPDLFKFRTVC
jgi:hypothetical protein